MHFLGKAATFNLLYAFPLLLGDAPGATAARPVSRPLGWAFAIWGTALYWWAVAAVRRPGAAAAGPPDRTGARKVAVVKAVVMAGGEGTRLRPMTANQPKPLLPVVNRPIMEHVLRLLKRHGFDETVVTVQFLAALVRNYFGDGDDSACTCRTPPRGRRSAPRAA